MLIRSILPAILQQQPLACLAGEADLAAVDHERIVVQRLPLHSPMAGGRAGSQVNTQGQSLQGVSMQGCGCHAPATVTPIAPLPLPLA